MGTFNTEQYFKAIANANGWGYRYGRKDYLNLYDVINDVNDAVANNVKDTVLFCHETSYDIKNERVSFELILAKNSDLDKDYSDRNTGHIHPMKDLMNDKVYNAVECEYDFTKFIVYDRINEFDKNMDGVIAFAEIQL